MQAVYSVDKEEVKLLLSKRADPNPLMVIPSVVEGRSLKVSVLVQIEFSPLMQASKVGSVEIARLLLAAGANPNLANDVRVYSTLFMCRNNKPSFYAGRSNCTNHCSHSRPL